MVKLVFWDLIGTIVSKNSLSSYFVKKLAKKYNKNIQPNSVLTKEEIAEIKCDIELSGYQIKPFAEFLLKKFHEKNIKQVIVSNGSIAMVNEIFKFSTIDVEIFDLILTSDQFKPKPELDMFNYAISKIPCKKEECCFFGDLENDAIAAKNFEIKFFKVNDSLNSYFQIAEYFSLI